MNGKHIALFAYAIDWCSRSSHKHFTYSTVDSISEERNRTVQDGTPTTIPRLAGDLPTPWIYFSSLRASVWLCLEYFPSVGKWTPQIVSGANLERNGKARAVYCHQLTRALFQNSSRERRYSVLRIIDFVRLSNTYSYLKLLQEQVFFSVHLYSVS